jgi:hypothetical protein
MTGIPVVQMGGGKTAENGLCSSGCLYKIG